MARPMPEPAPVIMATGLVEGGIVGCVCVLRGSVAWKDGGFFLSPCFFGEDSAWGDGGREIEGSVS